MTWQAASTHVTRTREAAAVIHALPDAAIVKAKHVTQFYTQNDAHVNMARNQHTILYMYC